MSRFFKSAAFPILIVVVLAFFASKLVSSNKGGNPPNYGQLLSYVKNDMVSSVTLDQKDNAVTWTMKGTGAKYTTGYPGDGSYLQQQVLANEGYSALNVQDKSTNGWISLLTYLLPFVIF
ncbi:MAG: cell division protein FtsH, partial [Acidobacteriota bacterium]|nr:cell division protein FtsH [Acidobacteriota bacterium]